MNAKPTFADVYKAYPYCFRELDDNETAEEYITELEEGDIHTWTCVTTPSTTPFGFVIWNNSEDLRFVVIEVEVEEGLFSYFAFFEDTLLGVADGYAKTGEDKALQCVKEWREFLHRVDPKRFEAWWGKN